MKNLFKISVILIFIIVLIVASTSIFIGTGYIISLVVDLDLFKSSILSLGATFVGAFIICVITVGSLISGLSNDREYCDCGCENEDDMPNLTVVNSKKVSRNEPCPCGSGKKYKHCCYGK